MKASTVLAVVLVAVLCGLARADIVISDDFNDNSLDTTKWWINTSGFNKPPTSATEQNQQMELQGRAHLNTVRQIDPATYPLKITGLWEFVSGDDFFQVLTRSDGQPAGTYGETNRGIEFQAVFNESFTIRNRGPAGVTGVVVTTSSGFDISAGDVFEFTILDNGLDLSFDFAEVGDASSWARATAQSSVDSPSDYIVFHNRESGRRSNLDDVRILAIPEPTTFLIWALLAGLGIGLARRRRTE
jgi:hypothetical protein